MERVKKKVCSKCKQEKELSKFWKHPNTKDGVFSQCIECSKQINKQWEINELKKIKQHKKQYHLDHVEKEKQYRKQLYLNNPEKYKQVTKQQYQNNPKKAKEYQLKLKYNLTSEQYDEMFKKQNGCCAICNKHQSKLKHNLSVDHSHDSGKVRGLLCHNCNLAIGLLNDDSKLTNKATQYLKFHTYKLTRVKPFSK